MSKGENENRNSIKLADTPDITSAQIYSFGDKLEEEITDILKDAEEKEPSEFRALVRYAYEAVEQAEKWAEAQQHNLDDEETLKVAHEIYKNVYRVISKRCLKIYIARVEDGGKETARERRELEKLRDDPDFDKQIKVARGLWADKAIAHSSNDEKAVERAREAVQNLQFYVDKHLMSMAILTTNEELSLDVNSQTRSQVLERNFRIEVENNSSYLYKEYILSQADITFVRGLRNPAEIPLETLRELASIDWLREQENTSIELVVLTNKLMGHQNHFIVSKKENLLEDLQTRKNKRGQVLRAHSRLGLPKGMERPQTAQLLEKMQKTLLKHKEEAASLLKTHLYLVHKAYKQGGDRPTFVVHMEELLEAKGYVRRSDGGFHPSTYREEWGRILTLAGCLLEVGRVTEKNKRGKLATYIDETPYWEVRAQRRLDEGAEQQSLFNLDSEMPIIKQAIIEPGAWWSISDRGTMNLRLPYELLALQTDGNGNESQRMAVQLGATLAFWVRSSQNQHAGKAVPYSVGKLLEAAGLKTFEDFQSDRPTIAKRLRNYLAGTESEPGGALHHLTSLKVFDICIRNEDEFWASGRGWQLRFWESMLSVQIPNLSIEKTKLSPSRG